MSNITIIYHKDILKATLELLNASELKRLVKPGMKVSLKPNLVMAKPASSGATTHVEIVEGLICYLHDLDIKSIEIIESAWVGGNTKQAFHTCGYEDLSRRYDIPLYDLKDDETVKVKTGEYDFDVCRKAVETDFLINLPVLKAHCQTRMTCCLKNLKGCIPDKEKRRFHALGLHRPISHLNNAIKTHFCLIDGICGDLSFEEGGNPVTRNMLLAGSDPVLLDSYCAGLMGYQPYDIEYIRVAEETGVGKLFGGGTQVLELNTENKPVLPKADRAAARYSRHIDENQACSACYSALVHALHRMGSYNDKISIGQGFRGKAGRLGCGNCTNKHDRSIPGCPPTAADILAFLKNERNCLSGSDF